MAEHIIKTVETEELVEDSGFKIVKMAFIYAIASIALAAVLVPWTNSNTENIASILGGDVDQTITGSVEKPQKKRTRIRRSVLQADPKNPCYILENGSTENDC